MNSHPQAAAIAAAVADRDSVRLAAAVTETVRLRALLPGGPIEEHGRDAVVARFGGWFADMDAVDLVESAGDAVADRLLIHYRLDLAQRSTRWYSASHSAASVIVANRGMAVMITAWTREKLSCRGSRFACRAAAICTARTRL